MTLATRDGRPEERLDERLTDAVDHPDGDPEPPVRMKTAFG